MQITPHPSSSLGSGGNSRGGGGCEKGSVSLNEGTTLCADREGCAGTRCIQTRKLVNHERENGQ